LLVRAFYVQHTAKTPFLIGLVAAFVNILSVWWFSRFMGVAGLALGFSIASIVNFVLLWMVLHYKLGELDEGRILFSSVKFSLAAIFCGSIVQVTKIIIEPLVNMNKFWGILTQGAIAGILGILGYMFICYITKSEEFFSIWRVFTKRLPWKKVETGDQGEARGI